MEVIFKFEKNLGAHKAGSYYVQNPWNQNLYMPNFNFGNKYEYGVRNLEF